MTPCQLVLQGTREGAGQRAGEPDQQEGDVRKRHVRTQRAFLPGAVDDVLDERC